jgi:hypothetical protein
LAAFFGFINGHCTDATTEQATNQKDADLLLHTFMRISQLEQISTNSCGELK